MWRKPKMLGNGKNPLYHINGIADALKFDFVVVPFYRFSQKGTMYEMDDDITTIIELDTNSFWAFIKKNNTIVGYINVLLKNKKWYGIPIDIFDKTNPMKKAFDKLNSFQPECIFTVSYLSGLWFVKDNTVMVYSFYSNEIEDVAKYINSVSSVKEIRSYSKGMIGGIQN